MPFSRVAESRIREAVERGEFDNLPNAGQPLNLEEYFSAPADLRMAHSILKNANCAPVEVELLAEVARLKLAMDEATDPAEREKLRQPLVEKEMRLAILLEGRRRSEK
jgi:hypothetical protein